MVFLGDNLIFWFSKRQNVISCSSAEAEYRAVANDMVEACWLCHLLLELYNTLSWDTLVYCDNVSTIYFSTNYVQHQCTKHVEIDLHFVRERVATGDVRVPTISQLANIFVKDI
jgi:hypothetical protein